MYNAYADSSKMIRQSHEERRIQLARTYASGQADSATVRLMIAKPLSALGNILVRMGESFHSGNTQQQSQELQPLRVRADNGN
jgi:hypothetical protein